MREINLYKSPPFGQHLIGGDFFMKSPLFKDKVEEKESKFLLPEDKDIVVNKAVQKTAMEDIGNGR